MKQITFIILMLFIASFECRAKKQQKLNFSISYEKFTLKNGLEVVLHEDHSDPIVAVATLMHVGSSREKPGRTGFAHFFEHMSFNDSENAPRGANRKLIPEWGGSRNGGTSNDYTIYYEVVPKDAFEKILWIDSDRFGYMINTVTKEALEREKQVVKNEKRQNVDNIAYGFTDEVISKNLYPEGHPYSWTVIGSLPDLQAATLDDVKEFYAQYYGAANATLVIAGDIDMVKTKELVKQWFGEIRKGPDVAPTKPMPVSLNETKSLYYEDDFAKLPEIRMVFPTVEQNNKDEYALNMLGQLLSGSKKAPLYKIIVEEKKLAPNVSSYQSSNEIAGEFIFSVRANAGTDLDSVKLAIKEGLNLFESEGFSDNELLRIKAELETNLYRGIENVLNKAFTLVTDNEFTGDPAYILKTAKYTNEVTREDIIRVYNKYIKAKNYVMTSFVPKGQLALAVSDAQESVVYKEENKSTAAYEEVSQGAEAVFEKTPSKFDRSEPGFGEAPLFKMPEPWTSTLPKTGIKVYGYESNEIPLNNFSISIDGGHWLDPIEKSGISNLLANLLMEGTSKRNSAELEEAIGLLGASINVYSSNEEIQITGSCLTKNFEATVALVEEILLDPRWDETEFLRIKQSLQTRLKGNEANPSSIASNTFFRLMYGDKHILGIPSTGTLETVKNIELEDLKTFYNNNLSASMASITVAGLIDKEKVMKAFGNIDLRWKSNKVIKPTYKLPENPVAGNVYFIDVPKAQQSMIFAGCMALSGGDPNYNNLSYANEILGGGSSGKLFQILRIEKGYTYGVYSVIQKSKEVAPFITYGSVRVNSTKASLDIIKGLFENYGNNFSEEDVKITKNKVLKSNTRAYEGLYAKLNILRDIHKYGRSMKYLEEDQDELAKMSLEDFKSIINKYLNEKKMIYLIVGDKASQLKEVGNIGKGDAIVLDIHGNRL